MVVVKDELSDVRENPDTDSEQPNLLSLALQHADKKQWATSETIWIWGD
ncbi:hypothetical protein ACFLUC_02730 [Chloroflexota bacterium]